MKDLSPLKIEEVKRLIDSKVTHREISLKVGVSLGVISNIRKKFKPGVKKNKPGKKPILNALVQRRILRQIKYGVHDNAVQINKELHQNDGINVSNEAVRKVLRKNGFHGRVKVKKPLLTIRHKKLRLEFAKKYKNYTISDWARVVWSDETKINRFGSDGRQWTWKKPGEPIKDRHVKSTIKFGGGNLMIWGCMTMEGIGECVKVVGRMDATQYVSILERGIQKSLDVWNKNVSDIIFQQDNDPKHTARVTKAWLQDKEFQLLDWPPQSPDLKPIEHLWVEVKRAISEMPGDCPNLSDLWNRTQAAWHNLSPSKCRTLVESMPTRIQAVLKAKGGHTKY